jgi:hypothetical protein
MIGIGYFVLLSMIGRNVRTVWGVDEHYDVAIKSKTAKVKTYFHVETLQRIRASFQHFANHRKLG